MDKNDLGGIVEQLRIIEGVECAIFLYETAPHTYKVSMRSNRIVDVSRIAAYFGGGGHIRAAGCTMSGSIHDVINNLSLHIENSCGRVSMYNGVLNIYKEKGYTSHDVVARLRGILHQKKIGHTGTLDPDAAGVLPVCLGQATRLADMLTDKTKTYEAVLLLGRETDTQDVSGQILAEAPVTVSPEEVRAAAESFEGAYEQVPPMYSAHEGRRKEAVPAGAAGPGGGAPGPAGDDLPIDGGGDLPPRVRMTVCCSKGTYIRTLCHDIGQKLGCGGCMEELLRTQVERFFAGGQPDAGPGGAAAGPGGTGIPDRQRGRDVRGVSAAADPAGMRRAGAKRQSGGAGTGAGRRGHGRRRLLPDVRQRRDVLGHLPVSG